MMSSNDIENNVIEMKTEKEQIMNTENVENENKKNTTYL